MGVTIREVAKAAGVAPSTVSRVVAGSSRISPETHEKVRRAMKELNYHPHAIARSLARQSTCTLGLIIARPAAQAFANPFFAEVIRGIGSVLEREGYNLLLSATGGERSERAACLEMLRSRHVDGVILTSSRLGDPLIADLVAEQWPFVLIGRVLGADGRPEHPGVYWVNNDNVSVGAMATEHLLGLGHRRIAMINGPGRLVVCVDRHQGYREALQSAGIEYDPALVVDGEFTQEGGQRAMEKLLSLREPPTAVVAADDSMAIGAMLCLASRGMKVPGDVAVAGVNDDPIASFVRPPLSTVRIPIFELGAMAAQMLVGLIRGQQVRPGQVILPNQLMVRESSGRSVDVPVTIR